MDLFGAAASAFTSGQGPTAAIKGLFLQWVSGPDAAGKLDAILREHNLPFSSAQVLGLLRSSGLIEDRDGGVVGTAKLQEPGFDISSLLQGQGGAGGALGGIGKLFG
ncbi:MAG TPA: hypothetical protein PKO15_18055 [Fibrobacteria bacterium]|nr:hypothetical protein [Fibrobacteria bacterium]HOX51840.1 hypothetical protein [Fibrobacteria bacterium]